MTASNMKKPFATLPLAIVILLAAGGLYWLLGSAGKVEAPPAPAPAATGMKSLATGPLAAFLVHDEPRDIAPFTFKDGAGTDLTLADFKGRVVLLNLWATWCAPCRKEMPDLGTLQREMGSAAFEVLALSLDRKGAEASAAFLKETGADNLALYTDVDSKSLGALKALGLPATVLVDREGRERGRLLGPANWASPEAKALINAVLSGS
jgi:thiol-disulfide isomerase/thioredoxin